jgi:hypothetical protein
MTEFQWHLLTDEDQRLARSYLGGYRQPDLTIGQPAYLHRWHVIPRNYNANVYLHVQVSSDPDRPLHDHPWDNQSVLLSGHYNEIIGRKNPAKAAHYGEWEPIWQDVEMRRQGGVYWRPAEQPHRLVLPEDRPYTMTLFTTGPTRRDWGFWTRDGWKPHEECVVRDPETGASIWNPDIPRERI